MKLAFFAVSEVVYSEEVVGTAVLATIVLSTLPSESVCSIVMPALEFAEADDSRPRMLTVTRPGDGDSRQRRGEPGEGLSRCRRGHLDVGARGGGVGDGGMAGGTTGNTQRLLTRTAQVTRGKTEEKLGAHDGAVRSAW